MSFSSRSKLLRGFWLMSLLAACASQPTATPVSEATATVPAAPINTSVPVTTATAVPPTAPPTATPIPIPAWTSWTAGNLIADVIQRGEQIVTGGRGGVTLWNADGTLAQRFTTLDGLPSNVVNTLLADADGTLWVGTDAGLARFDGQSWITYNTVDGLDSNIISALARVRGELIVGTYYSEQVGGGLTRFTGTAWEPVRGFPSDNPSERPGRLSFNINALLEDPLTVGGLWVATNNGLGHFDGQNWVRYSELEGLPANNVAALFIDQNKTLWAGTEGGAVRFNAETKQFESFRPLREALSSWVFGIAQDTAGRYWFGGSGALVRYDAANANWERYADEQLPDYTLTRGLAAQDGALFFGSDSGGLLRIESDQFTTWAIPNVPTMLSFDGVVGAPDGSRWFVEEYGVRANSFNPQTQTWSPIDLSAQCADYGYCRPRAFDAQGSLWASSDGGLWKINGEQATRWTTEQGLPTNGVNAVTFTPDGRVWASTAAGLAVIEGEQVTQVYDAQSAGFPSNYVRFAFAASDGSVWVSTETGLSHLRADGTWEHFGDQAPFRYAVRVNDLAEDANGALWVATAGDAVYRLAAGKWQRFDPDDPGVRLPSRDVLSLAPAPDGSVWFGTYASGAAHFDGTAWTDFDVRDGLVSAYVNDIYVDASGVVWFATSGGATRYQP